MGRRCIFRPASVLQSFPTTASMEQRWWVTPTRPCIQPSVRAGTTLSFSAHRPPTVTRHGAIRIRFSPGAFPRRTCDIDSDGNHPLRSVIPVAISGNGAMLRSENARLAGFVYVDIRGRDLKSAVRDMQKAVTEQVKLTPGYSVSWSGQFEFLGRATAKLKVVVPFTLGIIFV